MARWSNPIAYWHPVDENGSHAENPDNVRGYETYVRWEGEGGALDLTDETWYASHDDAVAGAEALGEKYRCAVETY